MVTALLIKTVHGSQGVVCVRTNERLCTDKDSSLYSMRCNHASLLDPYFVINIESCICAYCVLMHFGCV
jgi:hypothetical protein